MLTMQFMNVNKKQDNNLVLTNEVCNKRTECTKRIVTKQLESGHIFGTVTRSHVPTYGIVITI